MPYYSELGIYTSPLMPSSNSGVYLPGPYSNHSSIIAANFSRPPPILLKNRPFRTYKPHLSTITENHHQLRRVNSPKLLNNTTVPITTVPIPRPIKINTADIDVSVNKYRKYERPNRQQPQPQQQKEENGKVTPTTTTPNESPRNSIEKEAKPNKTIRRDRATIRIQTIHKDMLPHKLSTDTNNNGNNNNNSFGNRKWRDNFDVHELYDISNKPKERKTAGELLKEKFLIKDEQPEPSKNPLGKTPSFRDICQAITTNQIDSELNPGQPYEIQRRQSRQISTEELWKELQCNEDDAGDIKDKSGDYDSRGSVRKKKKYGIVSSGSNSKTTLQRRSTKKKLRKLSKDLVKDISQVEIEVIDRKPKPIITATVNIDETVEEKPIVNLKAIIDDVEVEESPKPQKKNRFKFNVIVEEIEESKQPEPEATGEEEQKNVIAKPEEVEQEVKKFAAIDKNVDEIKCRKVEEVLEEKAKEKTVTTQEKVEEKIHKKVEAVEKPKEKEEQKEDKIPRIAMQNKVEEDKKPQKSVDETCEKIGKAEKSKQKEEQKVTTHKKVEENKKINQQKQEMEIYKNIDENDKPKLKEEQKGEKVPKVEQSNNPYQKQKSATEMQRKVDEIEPPKVLKQETKANHKEDSKKEEENAGKSNELAKKIEETKRVIAEKAAKLEKLKNTETESSKNINQIKNTENKAIKEKVENKSEEVKSKTTPVDQKLFKFGNAQVNKMQTNQITNEIKKSTSCEKMETQNKKTEDKVLIKRSKSDDKLQSGSPKILTMQDLRQIKQVVDKRMAKISEETDDSSNQIINNYQNDNNNSKDVNFWDEIGSRESVYKPPTKPPKLLTKFELKPNESEIGPQSPISPKPLPSKRSLVNKANKDDPDLIVFKPPTPPPPSPPPEPEPEQQPEPEVSTFIPLQSNRLSQFMHPFKKPEQFDVCPIEIYAKPKTIRKRHYPRPRHPPPQPTPQPEQETSDEDDDDDDDDDETSSTASSSEDEYDAADGNTNDGSKIGASTSSNDSGFDSGVRRSRNKECDVNCHKKCEKLTANLCGINQKLIVEAIELVRKGSSEIRDHTNSMNATSIQQNPAFSIDEEFSNSSTYASFQKSGRITPPATTIPRFRKYTIDDFNFLKVLGKGSFGKVLLAELKNTEYYYAVKCLKKDVVLEDDDVECTLIERKVLALGTKHPYLCHLLCTFQTESHLFFVMEYLNGGDLMFHIQQSGRFPEYRAKFYGAEIVSGLKFLHSKGIVYRDLKLDNILLDFDGHVRIADFGMCKLQIFLDRMADTFCGTPDYMAPEIIKGQHYNQCVDWWSFGVLLYEMLLGQSPFSGCDEDELFWSICNEKPVIPRFLTAEASAILLLLLEKDANKRLGNRFCPAGDIPDQPFFRQIDWEKLEARQLEPPFKPNLQHPLDTQYFDRTFTAEKAKLTPTETNILQSMDQTQFQGFSYTNPNATDK